jgi:hypothetical protein
LALLEKAKSAALAQKATINYDQIAIDWDDYIKSQSAENWRDQFWVIQRALISDVSESLTAEFGIRFDVSNLYAGTWLNDYMMVFSEPILSTTEADLKVILEQARTEGWTTDEIRKQVGLDFDRYLDPNFTLDGRRLTDEERGWFERRAPRYRREYIARTEPLHAANAGAFQTYKAWGVVELKEWLSTPDDRVRASHDLAGATYAEGGSIGPIPLDEPFIVGGYPMMYPLDGSMGAPASEIVQCRCSVAPVIRDDVPVAERDPFWAPPEEVPEEVIPERPINPDEQGLHDEVLEVRAAYEDALRRGATDEAAGLRMYLDPIMSQLEVEQVINQTLWNNYQIMPADARDDEWRRVGKILEAEGYDLYKKYTKEGIALRVDEERNAKDAGYMVVGGKQIAVKQGAFSKRRAAYMVLERWNVAREELSEEVGAWLLGRTDYTEADIAQADYYQRLKLLDEMGKKEIRRTRSGKVGKIDNVPEDKRAQVIDAIDYDVAATAETAALDPLHLPSLQAYQKMEAADLLRSQYGEE